MYFLLFRGTNSSPKRRRIMICPSKCLRIFQLSSNDPWPSHNVPRCNIVVVGTDVGSTEAHEWNFCCLVSYSAVSSQLCAQKQLYYDLYCIGMSDDAIFGFDFALTSRRVSDVFFYNLQISTAIASIDGFIIINQHCISTNNGISRTTYDSYSFGDTSSEPLGH